MNIETKAKWHKRASTILTVSGISFQALVYVLEIVIDPNNTNPGFIEKALLKIQEFNVWILGSLTLIIVISYFAKSALNQRVYGLIGAIINKYRERFYQEYLDDPEADHRVTVFKYKAFCLRPKRWDSKWYWPWGKGNHPWSGWLVPVVRSGNANYSKTRAYFSTHIESPDAEGVAGVCFATQNPIIKPRLRTSMLESSLEHRKTYAKDTFCTLEFVDFYIKCRRPLAKSIGATPIMKEGRPWGVLVLDSRKDNVISGDAFSEFQVALESISVVLEV